jgi:hypothetical protein
MLVGGIGGWRAGVCCIDGSARCVSVAQPRAHACCRALNAKTFRLLPTCALMHGGASSRRLAVTVGVVPSFARPNASRALPE